MVKGEECQSQFEKCRHRANDAKPLICGLGGPHFGHNLTT